MSNERDVRMGQGAIRRGERAAHARRTNIRAILADPDQRRELLARCLKSTQGVEGRDMSWARAYEVVDQVAAERVP